MVTAHAALHARAKAVAPGGVHSPVRSFRGLGLDPVYIARAEGPRLIDVTGRSYIDFCQSFGPLILGHRDPDVLAAARAALDDGWSYGCCEPYSLELAEWIVTRVPWVERLRFVSSGTEAVMSALRVARAATGRTRIVKFEGCYHGHADGMLVKAGSGLAGPTAASSAGVPPATAAETRVLPLDDDAAMDRLFDAEGREIAAAIVEPLPANYGLLPQRAEWLRRLEARCRDAGALLILDEVISGFRIGITGMAGAVGIRPDLVCFGKVIGAGFPVGAYAGRASLMDRVAPAGPVYQAGTLSANPVGMRAGLAALTKMERAGGWRVIEDRTRAFCDRLERAWPSEAPSIAIVRRESIFWLHLATAQPIRAPHAIPDGQAEWFGAFFRAALDRGVYLPPSPYEVGFVSRAHDDTTLAEAADALVAAAAAAAETAPHGAGRGLP